MTLASVLIVVASAVAATAAPARAQQHAAMPEQSAAERSEELAQWLKEYRAWEKWFEQWGNRVAKNFNSDVIWKRKDRPQPPAWLAETCANDPIIDEQLLSACNILLSWDEQPLQIIRRRDSPVTTSAGKPADTVVKTSFFQHVHLTGMWTRAQYPAAPAYGIVGMQIGVLEIGRYTLPATGVMLVMISDGKGGHDWKPATTLGFGFRLLDFVPPLHRAPLSLHINIARTHIVGLHDQPLVSQSANVNFVGFSVSGRRRH